MAGTNAAAAKKALLDAIAASADTDLTGVIVSYSFSGKRLDEAREYIYGGKVDGSANHMAFQGSGRVPRREDLTLDLHVRVDKPGQETTETAELRAVAIGAAVENLIAADPDLSGVTGLDVVKMTGLVLDSVVDDQGAIAILTYQVALESSLG